MKKINPYTKTYCKISFVLFLLSASSALFAQNVGINATGATPNTAAILDLNTGNTFTSPNGMGLLIPNVALAGVTDAVTIASPPTSLLVYVPAGSGLTPAGYYYNSGTPTLPDWVSFGGGSISGAGTLNYVAKWTPNGSTLGNSLIFDNGTTVTLTELNGTGTRKLYVNANGDVLAGPQGPKTIVDITTTGSSSWIVPAGIYEITVYIVGDGGAGGVYTSATRYEGSGGFGAVVAGNIKVIPGESLTIYVGPGGVYTTGSPGGGGQGSYIARGTTLLAGAGGGGGGSYLTAGIAAAATTLSGYSAGYSFGTTTASLVGATGTTGVANSHATGGNNCIAYLEQAVPTDYGPPANQTLVPDNSYGSELWDNTFYTTEYIATTIGFDGVGAGINNPVGISSGIQGLVVIQY